LPSASSSSSSTSSPMLVARLDHSFKGGLLFLQFLSVFPQLLAQGI
jgi:hypothetical protein